MNKKLFSWKALAGLALLVAMGLTSCKQGTEVDPENPTPEKPVTPTAKGTELSGFKTVAELNKLLAETKDITDNIKAGGEVTITLDCSNLKAAAGDILVIPSKDDATINLVFANALKENKGLVISDAALDVLNIDFPAAEMGDITFDMPYSKLTVDSEAGATLGTAAFFTNDNSMDDLATTIGDGITIEVFKNWDDTQSYGPIVVDGAEIEALCVDANYPGWTNNNANGFVVPNATTDIDEWDPVYVTSLYLADDAWIRCSQNKKKTVVEKITIAEGKTLTLAEGYVNEVVGEGEGANVDYGWSINDFGRGTSFSNVTLDGNNEQLGSSDEPTESTFTNCTLVDFWRIYMGQDSATGLKFTFDNYTSTRVFYPVYADADDLAYSYEFSKCEFAPGVRVDAYAEGDNVLDKNGDPIKQTMYHYEWDNPDDDPDQGWIAENVEKLTDVPAAVRKGETGWYYPYPYEPRVYSFDGLELVPSFSECKYNDKAVSDKNVTSFLIWTELDGEDGTAVAETNYVQIGDKLYKRIWTKTNGTILVEQ